MIDWFLFCFVLFLFLFSFYFYFCFVLFCFVSFCFVLFCFVFNGFSRSVVWTNSFCNNFGLMIHETLHTFGLMHSNLRSANGFTPYGDGSCQMGYSVASNVLTRRGVSVPQMRHLGLLAPSEVVPFRANETMIIASGYLKLQSVKLVVLGTGGARGKSRKKKRTRK